MSEPCETPSESLIGSAAAVGDRARVVSLLKGGASVTEEDLVAVARGGDTFSMTQMIFRARKPVLDRSTTWRARGLIEASRRGHASMVSFLTRMVPLEDPCRQEAMSVAASDAVAHALTCAFTETPPGTVACRKRKHGR